MCIFGKIIIILILFLKIHCMIGGEKKWVKGVVTNEYVNRPESAKEFWEI